MGGWAKEAAEAEVDVSSEGTLVWVRRPNGSWWPGRVISRLDVPDGCSAPPRAPATPIMLLGRRDGPTFVYAPSSSTRCFHSIWFSFTPLSSPHTEG